MRVSVIIPVYNSEAYIAQCLDSILATEMPGLEIIAVDDGSSDRSGAILDQYAANPAVRVIHQANGGASKARNTGLDAACGEYIGFVDADDWVEPTMFSTMYNAAKEHDADIVFCNLYHNESEKMRRYLPDGVYTGEQIKQEIFPLLISNLDECGGKTVLRGAVWCRIFKRSIIEKEHIRFDHTLVYNEDGLFNIQAALHAKNYVYLGDEYLYHHCYVPGSVTKRYIPNLWERQIGMVETLKKLTDGCDYDFSRQIAKKTLEIAIYCAENEYKPTSPLSARERRRAVRAIMQNATLRAALPRIDVSGLKAINRGYYRAFWYRSVFAFKAICLYRQKKHKELQKAWQKS